MKLGAFLKQYLKQSLQVFKHPKQMLPTIILTVVWIILGILQIKLKENLPMKLLNFLTYAQGGLYGGIFGAIGGILGKVVVAAFVNALIVPLFMGKKPFAQMAGGWKELLQNIGFQSKSALAPLLKGFGAAMLIYILFNTTARFENSMAGIMAAVSLALAMGKKSGFMWELAISYANTVSKGKKLNYQSILRALTGMTLGFALAVALTVIAPSLVSLLGIVALIVGWIMGKGSKKEAVSTILLVILTLLPAQEARAQEEGSLAQKNGAIAQEDGVWVLANVKTTSFPVSSEIWGTPFSVSNISGTTTSYECTVTFNGQTCKFRGGVTPFEGPYKPGELVILQSRGEAPNRNWFYMLIFSNYWMHGSFWGPDDNLKIGWEMRSDNPPCELTFPTHAEVGSDELTYSIWIEIGEKILQTDYIFEWGGGNEILVAPDWVKELLGDEGEHANEVWTVFVSLVGGLMGGGLLGGAGGGAAGGGGLFPDGPGFLSPEDERRRRFLKDNDDGTRTMEDPATGKQYTLYPTYDEDGNQTGWKNENDTPYDEAGIDEWLDWRERNSSAFSQDNATAEQNLKDWRDRNEELRGYDEKEYKKKEEAIAAQRKKDDYIERVANKYFVGVDSKEKIAEAKRAIKKVKKESLQKYREMAGVEHGLSILIAHTERIQKICDGTVNIGAGLLPGGKVVRDIYSLAKNSAARAYEEHGRGGSFTTGAAKGAVEGGLEVWQNHVENVVGNAAIASVKSGVSKYLDGEDPQKIMAEMEKTAASQIMSNVVGGMTDKVTPKVRDKVYTSAGVWSEKQKVFDAPGSDEAWKTMSKLWKGLDKGTKVANETFKETAVNYYSEEAYKAGATATGWRSEEDFEDD